MGKKRGSGAAREGVQEGLPQRGGAAAVCLESGGQRVHCERDGGNQSRYTQQKEHSIT